jgi:hypothetical protein
MTNPYPLHSPEWMLYEIFSGGTDPDRPDSRRHMERRRRMSNSAIHRFDSVIGECVFTTHFPSGEPEFYTIDHADPHILISDEILNEIRDNGCDGRVRLDLPQRIDHQCPNTQPGWCFKDCIVHFNAANRTVIYRIGDYIPERNTWEASWPD